MAALSTGSCFHSRNTNSKIRQLPERMISPRYVVFVACHQNREPIDSAKKLRAKEEKEGKQLSLPMFFVGFEKLGKSLREKLSPKQKGDWKDLTLMSLSFAVYVYISQKIVCAYFAWMSIPRQPW